MDAVYIAASRSRTLYIGVTNKLQRRIWEHKTKALEGFTAKYNIDRLVYYELFYSITAAISREKQLKGWSRAKKLTLIATMNPTWLDLSEGWYHPDSIPARRPLAKS